jgi:hypothetical protein
MKATQQALLAVTALFLVVAVGVSIYETHRASELQAEITASRQQQMLTTQQLQQLRQERDEATQRLAALQRENDELHARAQESGKLPTNPPLPELSLNSNAESPTNFFSGLASMLKNPQMKEMVRAQQKMMIEQMYGGLYKKLSLSPADEDSLKQLLNDRQMALVDAGLAAMDGSGSDTNQPAVDTKTLKAQYDKQIEDLLGQQAYTTFQQYDQTVTERTQVNLFKQSLSADNVLTDQQENDLVNAMYQARQALPDNSLLKNQTHDPSQLSEGNIAEALKVQEQLQKQYADSAASILTPAQLDQFTKFQQQMSAMSAAGMKMAAQMFGQNKSASAPAASPGPAP